MHYPPIGYRTWGPDIIDPTTRRLSQLLVDQGKDGSGDTDDYEGGDSTPYRVGFREFPDRQDAKDGARHERDRDHYKRDPADDLRVQNAARVGF
jgi:hypothetical protein